MNPSFLISGEMGKKLLASNSTDSVFAEFLLHRMFNCSTFDGGTIETYGWKTASTGLLKYACLRESVFFDLWRDGKEALGFKFYRQRVC